MGTRPSLERRSEVQISSLLNWTQCCQRLTTAAIFLWMELWCLGAMSGDGPRKLVTRFSVIQRKERFDLIFRRYQMAEINHFNSVAWLDGSNFLNFNWKAKNMMRWNCYPSCKYIVAYFWEFSIKFLIQISKSMQYIATLGGIKRPKTSAVVSRQQTFISWHSQSF